MFFDQCFSKIILHLHTGPNCGKTDSREHYAAKRRYVSDPKVAASPWESWPRTIRSGDGEG